MPARGELPGGLRNNREFASPVVEAARAIPREIEDLLYDPQTSGGLLITLSKTGAEALERSFDAAYRIGRVLPRGPKPIRLV